MQQSVLIASIDNVLLTKLTKNCDECENHVEYEIRKNNLAKHIRIIENLLGEKDLREDLNISSHILSHLLIMYIELKTYGKWNNEKSKEYCKKLNCTFEMLYEVPLDKLLQGNHIFNSQEIVEQCFAKLHQKLTRNEYKHYPSLIEVYCSLIENVQNTDLVLNPMKTLPIALLLIDDYAITNKVKGLKCCKFILQRLSATDFEDGNFYEIVFGSLKKVTTEKDLEVTKIVLQCFRELLRVLPLNIKVHKINEVHTIIMDQLLSESNLYRKVDLFGFINNFLQIHGAQYSNKKRFLSIVQDNINICCNKAVGDLLLLHVLECFEEWIRHCWCIWQLSTDHKILSALFKILYACKEDNIAENIFKLIVTLISLCTDEEKANIMTSLKNSVIKNKAFKEKISLIKKKI